MFRRKDADNGLFDTTTEQSTNTQGLGGLMSGDTTTTTQPSSMMGTSTTTSASAAPVAASSAQPANPAARTTAEVRPEARSTPAPGASTFRPNTSPMSSMGVDMSRNRMPETKVSSSPSTGVGVDKANKTGRRVLTVGNDILLKGEIATCDRLVIEGKVDATLNDVHTVEIAETGSFKGSANIEDAEISGLFEGDLVVRNRLVIYATGKVRGKISYGEIEIERGGELTGEIKTTSPQSTSTGPRPTRAGIKEEKVVAA
jgi:cytoskeletal protein CcmA (bactofilin family)